MPEVDYTPRFVMDTLLERGRVNALRCPVYRAGALAAPTSGTATITNAAGTVVSTGAVTVSSSVATYNAPALASEDLGDGWSVSWALLMPDGVTHTYRNAAALVRVAPAPPATELDLYRMVPAINPSGVAPIHSAADFADQLDEAWVEIELRLLQQGNRPWLVVQPAALRRPHALLTLAIIFEGFASRLHAAYLEQARMYRDQYEDAWTRLSFRYDSADSGQPDSRRRPAVSSVWLCSRGD